MKLTISAIGALVALVMVFPISAGGAPIAHPEITALRHRVVTLAKENRTLRERNAELVAANGSLYEALKRAQAEIAGLNGQLRQAQINLEAVQGERDSLRAQLDALRNHEMDRAIATVHDEVTYMEAVNAGIGHPMPHGYVVSMTAMDYVEGHILAPEDGYRVLFGLPLPATFEQTLEMQAGLCGESASVFGVIVRTFGIPVRRVAFYYASGTDGHTAAETYYDGGWHYFDPTWGAIYGSDAVSITEARAQQLAPSRDVTLLWSQIEPDGTSNLSALTDPSTRVEFDNPPL